MFPAKFCDVVAAGLFCENIQNLKNDIWTTIFDKYSGDLFPRKNKTKARSFWERPLFQFSLCIN